MGKSDRQVLVAVGDSWTDENFQSSVYKDVDCSWPKWPEHLAEYLDMDVLNLGQSGSGNLQIFSKVVDATQLENIGGVVVMWSEPDRIDFEIHGAKDLTGYNSITDSAFYHWSPRRSLGNKRQTHMPLEKRYTTFFDMGRVQRSLQRSPTDFDHLAEEVLKLGIWHIATTWKLTFRYMFAVQNLLENLKIPYLQIQGTNPFFTWMMDEKGNYTQDYSDELNKLLGYIKNLDYMFSMDSEKFVGWPCFEKLGGYRTSNVIRDEKYRMGAEDSHPNKEGHRIIANHLLEEWNKIYK